LELHKNDDMVQILPGLIILYTVYFIWDWWEGL